MAQYKSKPGKYGTLYLWSVPYNDVPGADGERVGNWRTWAYNEEHAWDSWNESNEELGFAAAGKFVRVREAL